MNKVNPEKLILTKHAMLRMSQRRINKEMIKRCLRCGVSAKSGRDLIFKLDQLNVVVSYHHGTIIRTAYFDYNETKD